MTIVGSIHVESFSFLSSSYSQLYSHFPRHLYSRPILIASNNYRTLESRELCIRHSKQNMTQVGKLHQKHYKSSLLIS